MALGILFFASLLVVTTACDDTEERARFQLVDAQLVDDTVLVSVGYECGCGEHAFFVEWDQVFSDAEPPVVTLAVRHEVDDETCEGYCDSVVSYPLTTVTRFYAREFPEGEGEVLIRVVPSFDGAETGAVELTYQIP